MEILKDLILKETFIKNKKKLTFIDLFSGIGGFRYSLELLGCKCIGFSEINKSAIKTYKSNFNTKDEIEFGDISQINTKDIPDFDLLVAGFPCQDVSISGKRKGFFNADGTLTRSGLFFEIIRILKEKKPKYFILENVKGLVHHDKKDNQKYKSNHNKNYDGIKKSIGKTLHLVEKELEKNNYNFTWEIINTCDYGLPQNRERIIFIGKRKDLGLFEYSFPNKLELNLNVKDILEKNINETYYYKMNKELQLILQKEYLEKINKLVFVGSLKNTIKNYLGNKNYSRAYSQHTRIYCANGLAPTLCAAETTGRYNFLIPLDNVQENKIDFIKKESKLDINNNLYDIYHLMPTINNKINFIIKDRLNYFYLRKLTPIECLRLQGFPDNFYYNAIKNNVSNSQIYKQSGNAVSTSVIFFVAKQLLEKL